MFQGYRILIFTEDPDTLMPFYRDILEMEVEKKLDIPNDYGYMMVVNKDLRVWIGKHSNVKGKNQEKFRHIFNLYVESVSDWYTKVKNKVTIISKPALTPFATPENQVFVCTFLDPEDNCWQFMGGK